MPTRVNIHAIFFLNTSIKRDINGQKINTVYSPDMETKQLGI